MRWSKTFVDWTIGKTAYISVVFSWDLAKAYQRAVWYRQLGYIVRAGGPAVVLNPEYMSDVAEIGGEVDALPRHNADATFTSRGCIHKCAFCAVPRIEGELRELANWEPKPIVCDNNLLACSRQHFDRVIDKSKVLEYVDFQGIDCRLLSEHHAERFAELNCILHMAWDNVQAESRVMTALELLAGVGMPKKRVRVYVLFGFRDTPDDTLYRMETLKALGYWPNPMRYQPLDAERRNQYIAPGWTERDLKRFSRYWSRLAWLEHIPFAEYVG